MQMILVYANPVLVYAKPVLVYAKSVLVYANPVKNMLKGAVMRRLYNIVPPGGTFS